MTNPYLHFFWSLPPSCRRQPGCPVDSRELLSPDWLTLKASIAAHFAWAVPTTAAIETIAKHARLVVEIGCGSGYWAWMMTQAGVSVRAFDTASPPFMWHLVEYGDASAARAHSDRALFLCWPPYASTMATDALAHYGGDRVIYVGEWLLGCGDAAFFARLNAEFELIDESPLPQWLMRDDRLMVFERRRPLVPAIR
jgi:hypothetical protein